MFISDKGLDSRRPLKCSTHFPGWQYPKEIGVLVSEPFFHPGLKANYVDVHRQTIRIGTEDYGNCYPVEQAAERAEEATKAVISDLDTAIAELTEHRNRLQRTLKN